MWQPPRAPAPERRARATRAVLSGALLGVLWGALLATSAGCLPTVTCEDTGCAFGQVCQKTTGLCVREVADCRATPGVCGASGLCDERTGQCRVQAVGCSGASPCPPGQECDVNVSPGVCRPVEICAADEDCDTGQRCDRVTGRCVALPCQTSQSCDLSFVCDAGVCIPGCAPDAPRCQPGTFCSVLAGERFGQCLSECSRDRDCTFGSFCDFAVTPPSCADEPACASDEDCRDDEVCDSARCEQAPCVSDADCISGDQVCDRATGVCVGGDCTEDTFSPNHTQASARLLQSGTFINLQRCAGRPDWFVLELNAGEQLSISITHESGADLDARLFDDQGRLLRADERRQSTIALDWRATRAGALALVVDGPLATSARYDLSIRRTSATGCIDDTREENDHPGEATPVSLAIGAQARVPLVVCPGDEDWVRLLNVQAPLGLEVRADNPQGDPLRGELLTPDGDILSLDTSEARPLRLLRAGTTGDYFVRLRGASPTASASVQLSARPLAALECPEANVRATPERAEPLALNTSRAETFCPYSGAWEIDWFRLPAPEGPRQLTARLTPGPGTPPLSLDVFALAEDGTVQLIRTAATSAEGALVADTLAATGQTLLLRVSSEADLGRLLYTPGYTIEAQLSVP